jgi:hypothetical protein
MYPLDLNIEDWSRVNDSDPSEHHFNVADVIALTDTISWTNSEDMICDFNMHEYTH